jgi:haloacetate dehalogenase
MTGFAGFTARTIETAQTRVALRVGGHGPPLLLLHGFPQTHLMWREVAPLLAESFTVVCADLRGYGQSGCPPSDAAHEAYAKRALAGDMREVMRQLGFPRFAVAGHDRGGRVAYRLALDNPACVERLIVLDVVPTAAAWERADARAMLAFWPWSLLAQPAPLPEDLLTHAADAVVDDALCNWGSPSSAFPPEIRRAYIEALRDDRHAHAICEEYRAAASIDRVHDGEDIAAGRHIPCPVLVLWAAGGALDLWYAAEGGPLGLWRKLAQDVVGEAVAGGHFFPEVQPRETATRVRRFLAHDMTRATAAARNHGGAR